MDAQRWEQIQSLFLAALERQPTERAGFLEEACCGDRALAREVETLLSCHDEESGLAIENRFLVEEPDLHSDPREASLVNVALGPYQVVRRIGQGGMGEVYLAVRDEPYRQEVAVKVVRLGLQGTDVARRFGAERQILARLVHPNIARLLDGGVTADGRPYLVMEYVVGVPITEYCDGRGLALEDRLRLFTTVCDAVQFAHRNLIVHRDVKPSNVLVTEDGAVRLLDFGIAKLLDPEPGDPDATQTIVRLMTPDYAAPEQVRGDPVTTATDVYALGALLYELLTGHRPHRFSTRTPAEIERVICAEPPASPSAVVPGRPRRTLQGDLDNIVMMALRKEPERRYASAAQLAEDVERYLAGRPVIAQRDTVGYRLRKFVGRNRAGVAVAAGVLALIVGFGAVMSVQAGALARERDRVQLEADKATQVAAFLEQLFDASDPFAPSADRRGTMRVGELLARGAEKVRNELAEQPAVQAQLFGVLGSVFVSLGDFDAARPLLADALTIRERIHGGNHLEVAESRQELALLRKATGEYDEAESLLRSALTTRRALLGAEHADVASSLNALGSVLHDRGDFDGADSFYNEALAMRRRLLGDSHLEVAASLNSLSTFYYQRGDFARADSLVREALAMRRNLLGAEHPEVAMTMVQLATVSGERMEPGEVEGLYRDGLRILRATLGNEHPAVAHTLNNLAAFLRRTGEYDAAEPVYREALAVWRTLLGDEHPNVALTLHNLGALLKTKGDYDSSEPLYREALAMRRRLLGETHPAVAASLNNLAVLLKERGEHEEAIALLRQAIEVNTVALGPEHPRVAITMVTLGELLHETGRARDAEPLFLNALAIYRARAPEDAASVADLYPRLSDLYRDMNRPDQAALFDSLQREVNPSGR